MMDNFGQFLWTASSGYLRNYSLWHCLHEIQNQDKASRCLHKYTLTVSVSSEMYFTGCYDHRHKEDDDKNATCIYCPGEIHLLHDCNKMPISLSAPTFVVIIHRHKAEGSVYPSHGKHFRICFACWKCTAVMVYSSWDLLFQWKLLNLQT